VSITTFGRLRGVARRCALLPDGVAQEVVQGALQRERAVVTLSRVDGKGCHVLAQLLSGADAKGSVSALRPNIKLW
jgi:hypothetical protein